MQVGFCFPPYFINVIASEAWQSHGSSTNNEIAAFPPKADPRNDR